MLAMRVGRRCSEYSTIGKSIAPASHVRRASRATEATESFRQRIRLIFSPEPACDHYPLTYDEKRSEEHLVVLCHQLLSA